jgi:hypothetical protein
MSARAEYRPPRTSAAGAARTASAAIRLRNTGFVARSVVNSGQAYAPSLRRDGIPTAATSTSASTNSARSTASLAATAPPSE